MFISLGSATLAPLSRLLLAACIAAGLLVASLPAHAQTDEGNVEKVETLSAEGAALFRNGDYGPAIERFKQAYDLVPVANLLYNIALSYERLNDEELAIQYYELFIVADDADPAVRATALRRMQELDRKRRASKVEAMPAPADPSQPVAAPSKEEGSTAWTTAGIISAGIGVAMAGTGVVFALMANAEQDAFDQSVNAGDKDIARSAAENNALTADILFGGGAVAVIAGIVFILLDDTGGTDASGSAMHFIPIAGPDQLGAGVTVSF